MITVIQKNYVQYMSCQRPSQVDCHGNEISIASAGAAGGGGGGISISAWPDTEPHRILSVNDAGGCMRIIRHQSKRFKGKWC